MDSVQAANPSQAVFNPSDSRLFETLLQSEGNLETFLDEMNGSNSLEGRVHPLAAAVAQIESASALAQNEEELAKLEILLQKLILKVDNLQSSLDETKGQRQALEETVELLKKSS